MQIHLVGVGVGDVGRVLGDRVDGRLGRVAAVAVFGRLDLALARVQLH